MLKYHYSLLQINLMHESTIFLITVYHARYYILLVRASDDLDMQCDTSWKKKKD